MIMHDGYDEWTLCVCVCVCVCVIGSDDPKRPEPILLFSSF